MKKFLVCLTGCILTFSLIGCGNDTATTLSVNVENNSELNNSTLGKRSFVEIGGELYYDSATRIVYMVNGHDSPYESKTYCPYYAPNGLPYRYNPEINTLEEIKEK